MYLPIKSHAMVKQLMCLAMAPETVQALFRTDAEGSP